jgi:hypothetical protein
MDASNGDLPFLVLAYSPNPTQMLVGLLGCAVLSQSLIDLRAVMSLALPARRCYQSSRD